MGNTHTCNSGKSHNFRLISLNHNTLAMRGEGEKGCFIGHEARKTDRGRKQKRERRISLVPPPNTHHHKNNQVTNVISTSQVSGPMR